MKNVKKSINAAVVNRFLIKFKKTKGCWQWKAGFNTYGYGLFKELGKTIGAHRFSYKLFIGSIPKGLLVCHTCDNRACVNPKHLWIGTEYDNAQDCVKKGRQTRACGVKNGHSKLTEQQVKEIRNLKESSYNICTKYNVVASTIRSIRNGSRWAHL